MSEIAVEHGPGDLLDIFVAQSASKESARVLKPKVFLICSATDLPTEASVISMVTKGRSQYSRYIVQLVFTRASLDVYDRVYRIMYCRIHHGCRLHVPGGDRSPGTTRLGYTFNLHSGTPGFFPLSLDIE
jgi:hypothetical protein